MIYKLEPLDRVVSTVIRNLGLGDIPVPFSDMIEWMADGLEHIGAYYQLEEKDAVVTIQNHKGEFPCDLHKLIRVEHLNEPLSGHTGIYTSNCKDTVLRLNPALLEVGEDGTRPYDKISAYDKYMILAYPNSTERGAPTGFSKDLIGRDTGSGLYNISQNHITTSIREGVAYIKYLAMPIDSRGYPMIPDNVSFRDAMFWKVVYHLSMRDPQIIPNPEMRSCERNYQKWMFYCKQARGEANAPDEAMLSRIAHNWTSFFTSTYQTGFSTSKPRLGF